ncbi:MAG: hypothetical protein WB985_00160 [Candidatus Acidiferrales bacterium]
MKRFAKIVALLVAACLASAPTVRAQAAGPSAPAASAGQSSSGPPVVAICDLLRDRAAYNRKEIEVTGIVSVEFEDFTIFDPTCDSNLQIWLEYGAKARSGVVSTALSGRRTAPKTFTVETIEISLDEDSTFQAFSEAIHGHSSRDGTVVRAILRGRFFAGRIAAPSANGRRIVRPGYGHMGCCSLFAIEQVVSFDKDRSTDLDYSRFPEMSEPVGSVNDCFYSNEKLHEALEQNSSLVEAQRAADSGRAPWAYDDPKKVAQMWIANELGSNEAAVAGLMAVESSPSRAVFAWTSSQGDAYRFVLTRPYWLQFYARDPQRVAWVRWSVLKHYCRPASPSPAAH